MEITREFYDAMIFIQDNSKWKKSEKQIISQFIDALMKYSPRKPAP